LAAKLRKHRTALVALAIFHFAVFFPLLFMGRVISPNDIFYAYEPWASHRPASVDRVQNPLMNDPATAWLPLMVMLKNGAPAFHWDPYIGSGVPGFGSSGSALLSPLILLPVLLLPLTFVYSGIILMKINAAFWFAYLWLREERLGKIGAAAGAVIIAGAGAYTTRWLWQSTNASVFYPALLWMICRAFHGKRTPLSVVVLIALAYALSGFPSTMAYGAYLAVAYAVFLAIRERRLPILRTGELVAGVVIGLMIAAPSLAPFIHFIRRSGYLDLRQELTARTFPPSHWWSFIDPERLGHPVWKNWSGEASLLGLNNFVEASVFLGVLTIPLAVAGLFAFGRRRYFWVAAAAVILLCMFGLTALPDLIGELPGFKYTPLARLSLLLPVPAAFLAGTGVALVAGFLRGRLRFARPLLALACAGTIAWELGVFAGTFHPYLTPRDARVPSTRVTDFLRADEHPFRLATFLTYLWPNSAQLYGIEDIGSHFGSEADYRRLIQRIDPTAWSGRSTVITFNSLNFRFNDPLVSMLGVRYFLEHRAIDIIKWSIFSATKPSAPEQGSFVVVAGTVVNRTITVEEEPFWAIEVPVNIESATGALPRVDVELTKGGATVWSRTFHIQDVAAMNKLYVPLRPFARKGETVGLRLWASSMNMRLLRASAPPGDTQMYYGRVTVPFIFDRELPEGRVFRNLGEVPRFNVVRRVRKLNDDEFIRALDVDFAEEAVITDDPVFPPEGLATDGKLEIGSYHPSEQRLLTTSSGPIFVASSEKLTPELQVTIDGRKVRPVEINMLFAGVVVPPGRHEVVFQRRIGREWWPACFAGLLLFVGGMVTDITRAWRRR
jgi:hypothetical protein